MPTISSVLWITKTESRICSSSLVDSNKRCDRVNYSTTMLATCHGHGYINCSFQGNILALIKILKDCVY